jgi:hypothetical protein
MNALADSEGSIYLHPFIREVCHQGGKKSRLLNTAQVIKQFLRTSATKTRLKNAIETSEHGVSFVLSATKDPIIDQETRPPPGTRINKHLSFIAAAYTLLSKCPYRFRVGSPVVMGEAASSWSESSSVACCGVSGISAGLRPWLAG